MFQSRSNFLTSFFSRLTRSKTRTLLLVPENQVKFEILVTIRRTRRARVPKSNIEPKLDLNINQLNDDCLIAIFSKHSLQELVHLRNICSRWKTVIEIIFKGRSSLKLFVSYRSVKEYLCRVKKFMADDEELRLKPAGQGDDDLVLNPDALIAFEANQCIDQSRGLFLPVLFPNITKLFICLDRIYFNDYAFNKFDFANLLNKWPNLSTLLTFNFPSNATLMNSFFNAISSLSSLRSLYLIKLKGNYDHDFTKLFPSVVLHRLEQLTMVSKNKTGLENILTRLGPNCSRITFNWRCFASFDDLPNFRNVTLAANRQSLKYLSFEFTYGNITEYITKIFEMYSSIEFLKIQVSLN